jgi:hypothetical protein
MARRPAHEPPSPRSARSGPRAKQRPMSGGDVDPRWSNPDLRDEGDSAASGSSSLGRKGGSDTRSRGDFGSRRAERPGKPRARGGGTQDQRRSNSEPHVRKGTGSRHHAAQSDSKKPRAYIGGGGAGRRPRDGSGRDPQSRRRDEQGSRPQRTGAGGASPAVRSRTGSAPVASLSTANLPCWASVYPRQTNYVSMAV